MKKLMIAASAALCAAVGFAVESANIVGYTNKDADQGKFYILGAGFEQVAGGTAVNGLISGVTGVDYDEGNAFMSTAAQIQIPNAAGGYTTFYYLNDGWYDDNGKDGFKAGWCNGYGVLVDDQIPAGQGVWTKGVTGAFTLTFTK